ncbi:hypothetical protein RCL1_006629 [Eukaryota sp. TZLM3-RCL]
MANNDLLAQIRAFKKGGLKPTETVDKSTPLSSKPPTRPVSRSRTVPDETIAPAPIKPRPGNLMDELQARFEKKRSGSTTERPSVEKPSSRPSTRTPSPTAAPQVSKPVEKPVTRTPSPQNFEEKKIDFLPYSVPTVSKPPTTPKMTDLPASKPPQMPPLPPIPPLSKVSAPPLPPLPSNAPQSQKPLDLPPPQPPSTPKDPVPSPVKPAEPCKKKKAPPPVPGKKGPIAVDSTRISPFEFVFTSSVPVSAPPFRNLPKEYPLGAGTTFKVPKLPDSQVSRLLSMLQDRISVLQGFERELNQYVGRGEVELDNNSVSLFDSVCKILM